MNGIENSVTVCLSRNNYNRIVPLLKIGDKVRLAKNNKWVARRRIKNKEMVFRLLKKQFRPTFVVTASSYNQTESSATIKPFNF